jgi:hypothetical protein
MYEDVQKYCKEAGLTKCIYRGNDSVVWARWFFFQIIFFKNFFFPNYLFLKIFFSKLSFLKKFFLFKGDTQTIPSSNSDF